MSKALAIDLGASSGRITLAALDGDRIQLEEVHRFTNGPVNLNGTLYWDILRIFSEIKDGIAKASANGGFGSIGIDTWGVDFGLIDARGQMVGNPIHYRDGCTDDWPALFDRIPKEYIYQITGIQNVQVNTIYRLDYLARECPGDLARAKSFLMIPDLLNYFLTGEMQNEYTEASTTQLLDAKTRRWSVPLLNKLGVNPAIFKNIIMPGTPYGMLLDAVCEETRANRTMVYSVASHDTASAVVAVPAPDRDDFMYISSGTWSLVGTELSEPLMSEEAMRYNFTNEGGAEGRIRFLKNVMGSFILQESKKQWAREGRDYDFRELDRFYEETPSPGSYIDVDDAFFYKTGDMPSRIRTYCEKTGQRVPQTVGEIMRVIFESLSLKYRLVRDEIETCTGKKIHAVYIVGGGSQSETLCQITADATGLPVYAGLTEATTIGNAVVQWIASGELGSVTEARRIIKDAFPLKEFRPQREMDDDFRQYAHILGL